MVRHTNMAQKRQREKGEDIGRQNERDNRERERKRRRDGEKHTKREEGEE
jgi:hypothetical protein